MAAGQNRFGLPSWGFRCTTHFRSYFSGDWDELTGGTGFSPMAMSIPVELNLCHTLLFSFLSSPFNVLSCPSFAMFSPCLSVPFVFH